MMVNAHAQGKNCLVIIVKNFVRMAIGMHDCLRISDACLLVWPNERGFDILNW